MTTVTKEKRVVDIVPPFGIRVDHPRMCDVLLQCIPNARLRSSISSSKPVKDQTTGEEMIPVDQATSLASFPKIPGMRIHVNPAKLTYTITDPLRGNEDLCEKIRKRINERGAFTIRDKVEGVPPQDGSLDEHRMKSLCRELLWLLEAKEAKMTKGPEPTMKLIEKLPGYFLTNPGKKIPNSQPEFEHQIPAWRTALAKAGI